MEVTNLDRSEDDGLMERLTSLCERVHVLLERVRGGHDFDVREIEAVQREALLLGLEKDPSAFRPFAAQLPVSLN